MSVDFTQRVSLPSPGSFNTGLTCPNPAYMEHVLGQPRFSYAADCQPVTSPSLKPRMVTLNVGPFKCTGFDLFLALLTEVFAEVKEAEPELWKLFGTAGCLCCRYIRGTHVPSNHSWGCAIDMEVGGVLVPLGADYTIQGLLHLYGYMHKHKIYSGMGYHSRPDSMHFEASEELIQEWRTAGKLPA